MLTPTEIKRIASLVEAVCRSQGRRFRAHEELVEEVYSDVRVRMLDYLRHGAPPEGELERYVRYTARREASERYRRHLTSSTRSGRRWLPLRDEQPADDAGPLQRLMRTEEQARVEYALKELPAHQAAALATYAQDGDRPTVAELARLWNRKEGYVYYTRSLALKAVRARLGVREEDFGEN